MGRLLQGLVYCTNTGYAQLGFPTHEEREFFERPSKCHDTLVIPGLVHVSVVLPSTNGGLGTSLAPWKFALEGGTVQRRLVEEVAGAYWPVVRLLLSSEAWLLRVGPAFKTAEGVGNP